MILKKKTFKKNHFNQRKKSHRIKSELSLICKHFLKAVQCSGNIKKHNEWNCYDGFSSEKMLCYAMLVPCCMYDSVNHGIIHFKEIRKFNWCTRNKKHPRHIYIIKEQFVFILLIWCMTLTNPWPVLSSWMRVCVHDRVPAFEPLDLEPSSIFGCGVMCLMASAHKRAMRCPSKQIK